MPKKEEVTIMNSKPKWLRSRYQLKKEIRRRFVENATAEYINFLIDQEVKLVFGDRRAKKPLGILNFMKGENDETI